MFFWLLGFYEDYEEEEHGESADLPPSPETVDENDSQREEQEVEKRDQERDMDNDVLSQQCSGRGVTVEELEVERSDQEDRATDGHPVGAGKEAESQPAEALMDDDNSCEPQDDKPSVQSRIRSGVEETAEISIQLGQDDKSHSEEALMHDDNSFEPQGDKPSVQSYIRNGEEEAAERAQDEAVEQVEEDDGKDGSQQDVPPKMESQESPSAKACKLAARLYASRSVVVEQEAVKAGEAPDWDNNCPAASEGATSESDPVGTSTGADELPLEGGGHNGVEEQESEADRDEEQASTEELPPTAGGNKDEAMMAEIKRLSILVLALSKDYDSRIGVMEEKLEKIAREKCLDRDEYCATQDTENMTDKLGVELPFAVPASPKMLRAISRAGAA